MDPAKQAKVMREFQKQSAQMDMTVRYFILYLRKYMPFYHFALEH